jgi:hypothetical protein
MDPKSKQNFQLEYHQENALRHTLSSNSSIFFLTREDWYEKVIKYVYQSNPALLGGCRGVYLLPYLHAAGFNNLQREFISQLKFPSEAVIGQVR